ncbi:MAG: sigW 5 [Verrucomicrobia bacterium]|nr:sigW 5 [Verrucomicrobiota bacterium]
MGEAKNTALGAAPPNGYSYGVQTPGSHRHLTTSPMKTAALNSHPPAIPSSDWPRSRAKFDDGEVVDGLRAGSTQALEQIIAVYRPRIYAQALRLTRNHHEAEEIVQDTFLRAYRAAPNFRGESSLSTWLHAIVGNLARNRYWYWQRRKRHETISLDQPLHPDREGLVGDAIAVEGQTAIEESEQNDLVEQIAKGMERLSEQDRRILVLRNVQHAAYTEIARALGLAIGTVKSRLTRARERLRTLVQAEMGDESPLMRKAS